MSRSNPTESLPHPCERWFEWNGEKGNIRWYNKETKSRVEVNLPFSFILLDQLAGVKGWSDKLDSGLYSNEVKDTRSEPFVVKAFKGGEIAKGLYAEIKDTILAAGGHFVLNLYAAVDISGMELCSIQFKGAALGAWMEFEKKNRADVWKQHGVQITGYKEGQKGKVVFRVPEFALEPISKDDDNEATNLDRRLQQYLRIYFKKGVVEPVQPEEKEMVPPDEEDDIPF